MEVVMLVLYTMVVGLLFYAVVVAFSPPKEEEFVPYDHNGEWDTDWFWEEVEELR